MSETNQDTTFQQQRLKLLLEQSTSSSYAGIVSAIACFFFFAHYHYSHGLLAWALIIIVASIYRIQLHNHFDAQIENQTNTDFWLKRHNAVGIVSGLAWGFLALIPHDGLTPIHETLFLLIPTMICTVAISSYAIEISHYRNFLLATFISAFLAQLITATDYSIVFAITVIISISAALLYITANRYHRGIIESLETNSKLRLANQHLEQQHDLLSQEEDIARHVFEQLTLASENTSLGIYTWNQAMGSLSGDLIQIARGPKEQTYILLGDFTGHGLPAALGAVPTSAIFNTMANKGLGVSMIAGELNRKLHELLPTGYFCCAAVMELSSDRHQLKVWNGGLPPLIIRSENAERITQIKADNLPLGVVGDEDFSHSCSEWTLKTGDTVYAYSDGLTEAEDINGEMWGSDRFSHFIERKDLETPRLESLKEEIMEFTNLAPASDDISIIEIETSPKANSSRAA